MLTAEQLEARKSGIGGSDAGAVLGLNRYATPLSIYRDKIGEGVPFEGNDATHWGNILEDVIAQEYARRTGQNVRRRKQLFRHKEHDFLIGNIDRSVDGKKIVLECKTAGQFMSNEWGPDGSDQVPDSYLIQCTHYMIATGYRMAHLAVLIGGRDFRMYKIPFDQGLADLVVEKEDKFWHDHVLKRIPPDPINFDDLAELYAHDKYNELLAGDELYQIVRSLAGIKTEMKALKEREDALKFLVQKEMGENAVLIDCDGQKLATWKNAKDSQKTDWKKLAMFLMSDKPGQFQKNHISQFTETVQGSRRFLVKI